MTSRFALLTAMAGIIGFGCSGDDGTTPPQPPPPSIKPAGAQQAAAPAPTPQPAQNTPPPAATNTQTNTPVATGGTGGAPGATGAAGAGAGGAPATGVMIPVGTGNAITPAAGHVAGTTNGAGIQGDFYTFGDFTKTPPGTTTIAPATFAMATGAGICVSGSASQLLTDPGAAAPNYGRYYGGGVGFNLADPGGGAGPQPWTRGKVVGFSYNITGTTIPAGQLRFGVNFYEGSTIHGDPPYCKNIVMGANTVMLSTDVTSACYTPGGPGLDPAALLQSLQWQVVTVATAATPFNFCIENLTAIVSP